jgi:hypothetical protein
MTDPELRVRQDKAIACRSDQSRESPVLQRLQATIDDPADIIRAVAAADRLSSCSTRKMRQATRDPADVGRARSMEWPASAAGR